MTRTTFFTFFLAATLLSSVAPVSAESSRQSPQAKKTRFEMKRGLNIAHWLSQSDSRGEERANFFTENDVKNLAAWGFDHIRLPVAEEQLVTADGAFDNETITLIENAIKWCKKHKMKVIFDLHIIKAHHFNEKSNTLWHSPDAQRHLCDLWEKIARRLDKYPVTLLAFELLNEPVAEDNEEWNKVLDKLLPAVRSVNSKRIIMVASNKWNSVDNIPNVRIPDNDPNLILTFHFYEPMILTHYRASWTDQKDLVLEHGVSYPGCPVDPADIPALDKHYRKTATWWAKQTFDKQWMRTRWQKAMDYASEKGLTLYLGEFGCYSKAKESSRLAWVNDVASLCDELGIPRAYWEYKSEFGFADWNTGELTNPPLLKAIIQ